MGSDPASSGSSRRTGNARNAAAAEPCSCRLLHAGRNLLHDDVMGSFLDDALVLSHMVAFDEIPRRGRAHCCVRGRTDGDRCEAVVRLALAHEVEDLRHGIALGEATDLLVHVAEQALIGRANLLDHPDFIEGSAPSPRDSCRSPTGHGTPEKSI